MPFIFLLIGAALVASGVRNTQGRLGQLIAADFTGPNNFWFWIAAIGVVGSIGYVPGARGMSRAFLLLILIVMVLSDQGFFAKAVATIEGLQPTPATPAPGQAGGAGGGGSDPLEDLAGNAAKSILAPILGPFGNIFGSLF
jgi:hypothetical protein